MLEIKATKYHGAFVIVAEGEEAIVWPPIREKGDYYHPNSPRDGWQAAWHDLGAADEPRLRYAGMWDEYAKGGDLEDVLYIFDGSVAEAFRNFDGWTEFTRHEGEAVT